MKKFFAALATVLIVFCFASCTPGGSDNTTAAATTLSGSPYGEDYMATVNTQEYSAVVGDWEYVSNVLPEFTAGTLIEFEFDYFEEGYFRAVEVEETEFRAYVDSLRGKFFTEKASKIEEDSGGLSFTGQSKAGVGVMATFVDGQVKVEVGR